MVKRARMRKEDVWAIACDAGNALAKFVGYDPSADATFAEGSFPHVVAEIDAAQYEEAMELYAGVERGRDYLVVNDRFYVVGESAVPYQANIISRYGASRYQVGYYDLILMRMLAEMFANQPRVERPLFGLLSYAAVDHEYRRNLREIAASVKAFRAGVTDYVVRFVDSEHFNETHGGYMVRTAQLTESGWTLALAGMSVAVLDIGGSTITAVKADADSNIVAGSVYSVPNVGILTALDNLKAELRRSEALRDAMRVTVVSRQLLMDTLRTGEIYHAGRRYNVHAEVERALKPVLRSVEAAWQSPQLGGGLGIQRLVLTGGGAALLYPYIVQLLDGDGWVELALPDDPANMHMANVRGAIAAKRFALSLGLEIF